MLRVAPLNPAVQGSILHSLAKHSVPTIESLCAASQGWTPLMSAVSANREPLVKLLLDHAADVHATNSSGQTALHYAVRFQFVQQHQTLCQYLQHSCQPEDMLYPGAPLRFCR